MAKYRIKKFIDKDRELIFRPQKRFLFIWIKLGKYDYLTVCAARMKITDDKNKKRSVRYIYVED